MSRLSISFSIASLIFLSLASKSLAASQSNTTVKHSIHTQSAHIHPSYNSKCLFLVPPPPPYVPALLPELTYSRYYGHSPYTRVSNSPKIFKPNKYLTYYL